MASLDDIVQLTVTIAGAGGLTKAGFGIPMIACYHTHFTSSADIVRVYNKPADMLADGFASSGAGSAPYKIATALCAQNPHVNKFKVGRRTLAPTQIFNYVPTALTVGYIYAGTIGDVNWAYTVGSSHALADVCTGIASAIAAAQARVTAVGSGTHVVVTAVTPGDCLTHTNLDRALLVNDVTVDPGIATDLSAIKAADSNWYGLQIDGFGKAEIVAADTWLEANQIALFDAGTGDTDIINAVAANTALTLEASSAGRTGVIWNQDFDWKLSAGILGQRLTAVPGADTWHLKNVTGPLPSDFLTATQVNNLKAARVSYYQTLAGLPLLFWGTVAKPGVYYDQVRGRDWANNTIQINIVARLSSVEKVPFTDEGIEIVKGAILAALTQGVKNGYIAANPAPTVSAPRAQDVDSIDRGNRLLPDVTFQYTEAGAIHSVVVQGTVQV